MAGSSFWASILALFSGEREVAPPPPRPRPPPAGPLPSPATIAALPDAEGPRGPWHGVLPAPSTERDPVREALAATLQQERSQLRAEGDRLFFDRLLQACASDLQDIPLFPDASLQLDALLRRADTTATDVARIVRREPGLTKRVWLEANSVQFSSPVSTLDEAIVRVGFEPIWRLGMRACMNAPVFRVGPYQDLANHARGVGIVSAEVASTLYKGGDVFLAGLLHAIGSLLVLRAAVTRPKVPAPDPDLVTRAAHRHFPSIGVLMATAWKMPPTVIEGIAFAPAPGPSPTRLVMAVHAGVIATHTAAEARAQRDDGGLQALMALPGPVDAARLIAKAHAAWAGLEVSRELEALD